MRLQDSDRHKLKGAVQLETMRPHSTQATAGTTRCCGPPPQLICLGDSTHVKEKVWALSAWAAVLVYYLEHPVVHTRPLDHLDSDFITGLGSLHFFVLDFHRLDLLAEIGGGAMKVDFVSDR